MCIGYVVLYLQENIIPILLNMRNHSNRFIQQQSNQALALLGYITPVRDRGVKILSLDGGGTRSVSAACRHVVSWFTDSCRQFQHC